MKGKQPSRQQLAEHIDALVQALVEIHSMDGNPIVVEATAFAALQNHNKWVKREF